MKIHPATVLLGALTVFGPILLAQQAPGVPNFHQVNDHIYRGAQPSSEGFHSLAKLGVKTVIDLRGGNGRSKDERKTVEANGMHYVSMPLDGFLAPSAAQVSNLLSILNDGSAGPVFVHCRRGADRTGTIIAVYRITHDHWDNRKALDEASANGMSHAEVLMKHYVLAYQAAPALPAAVPAAAVPASVQ